VALGAIVTLTHTAGVFALGLATLLLIQYFLPEDVYPWLDLAAGLLIVAVGIGVLSSRIRWARRQRAGDAPEHEAPDHHHHHHPHRAAERRGLLAMGVSAGLIPCPSALVVLLAALYQQEVGLGLVLIVAFSLGLAVTLTALGLAVVYAKRAGGRLPGARRFAASRLGAALPALSTLLILGLGVVLTLRALPAVL
jgi:ABC-type nickel/cobalt efflux system permease component RcnA